MRLAVQLYTLRDHTKTWDGLDEVLGRCADMGYEGAQVSAVGCLPEHPETADGERVREMLERRGMVCIGTHRPWPMLSGETEREIRFHRALGGKVVGIGHMGGAFPESSAGYRAFAEAARPVHEKLTEHGMAFGYHNHAHEFVREDGAPRFQEIVDAPWIEVILDVYWVQHAGYDPAYWLEQLHGRAHIVHFKDKEVVDDEGPIMAPVGEGNLDWPRLTKAALRAGTEWATVEQDVCRRDPFDCLASSARYLHQLLADSSE